MSRLISAIELPKYTTYYKGYITCHITVFDGSHLSAFLIFYCLTCNMNANIRSLSKCMSAPL